MIDFEGLNVFISGPVTGRENGNREAFDRAVALAVDGGARTVYSPAHAFEFERGEHPHEHYMLRTLSELCGYDIDSDTGRRTPRYDVCLMLPGFEDSEGAMTEMAVAQACGIRIEVMNA